MFGHKDTLPQITAFGETVRSLIKCVRSVIKRIANDTEFENLYIKYIVKDKIIDTRI